jgi:HAD superfamily hydrolase (TIGR01484 family)
MRKYLIILDFDGTLVDRTDHMVGAKIQFKYLSELQVKYQAAYGIRFDYLVLTSSCCESIENIMTVTEMKIIDRWFFENGLHQKVYSNPQERVIDNEQTKAFNEHRHSILEHVQSFLGDRFDRVVRSVSEKQASLAIHVNEQQYPLSEFLKGKVGGFCEVIRSGDYTLELFPLESNKAKAMQFIPCDDYYRVIFIGDSAYAVGNDAEIAVHPDIDLSIEVNDTVDSTRIIQNILQHQFQDPFHPSILNFTQARIIKGRSIESKSIKNKRFLLLDFDGTLTYAHGLIYPRVLDLLYILQNHYQVWVVTGRSMGWCDMMMNIMPVQGVIGENGAFAYYRERLTSQIKIWSSPHVDSDFEKKLLALKADLIAQFPRIAFASDQFTRVHDLAIVINENGCVLTDSEVEKIVSWCRHHEAESKISNIHINSWFGHYNKAQSVVELFHDVYGVDSLESFESSIYIGDSPNDEPLFRLIDSSYGVKNVESYLKTLRYPPRKITTQDEGMGAAEVLEGLVKDLRKRQA